MRHTDQPSFDVLEVLTRTRGAREAFLEQVAPDGDLDAALVSDVLRSNGRVSETRQYHRELAELCAVLRAIDANRVGLIDLADLQRGIAAHGARTDEFERFHEARVLLRTLGEVLTMRDEAPARAVEAQVSYIHEELEEWLAAELLGVVGRDGDVVVEPPTLPHHVLRVTDPGERAAIDAAATELLDGAAHHPVTGLAGAAWVRGWAAVPVANDLVSDDEREPLRLAAALRDLGVDRAVLLLRTAPERWDVRGATVAPGDGFRPSYAAATDDLGIRALTGVPRGAAIITDLAMSFAVLEAVDHHVIAGPRAFVEQVLGRSSNEAFAAFREFVESLALEGEPPEDLLEVARRYGRLRRRASSAE
ncbi:MAG: hypothetical protein JWO69_1419 [Thermoleophilia bacterium]|jgi:hypothetical protein|nr:hypothetical protein [Thermoleophilia bacterium]